DLRRRTRRSQDRQDGSLRLCRKCASRCLQSQDSGAAEMKKVAFILLIACIAIPSSGYITQRKLLGNAILQVKWPSSTMTWNLVPTQGTLITGSRSLSTVADASFATWDAIP